MCTLQRWHPYTVSFLICCIQHHLHLFPSLRPLWTFSWFIFICSCHRPNVQWGFCLPFSKWKSSNQSHCNLKSNVMMNILIFGLTCWSLAVQNVDIHYAGVKYQRIYLMLWLRSGQHHISCAFDHDDLQHSWMFCGWFTWITLWPNLMSVWTTFLRFWICNVKSYNSIVLPNSGHQVWAAILVWFVSTMDHSTRFTNTLWKILLIHLYCPISVCFTSHQVFQWLNRCKQVVTIDMMIFSW